MICSVNNWKTNAHLIADIHTLIPLNQVRDITYGRGLWWTKHTPNVLHGTDILTGTDFRNLPDHNNTCEVVAFDPPYIPQTKQQIKSSTLTKLGDTTDFADRYGLTRAATTPTELRQLIQQGLSESYRILKPKGIVLFKSMNYIVSGKYTPQTIWAAQDAEQLGYSIIAQFIHHKTPGPQPVLNPNGTVRAVKSARNNYSTMLILRKP